MTQNQITDTAHTTPPQGLDEDGYDQFSEVIANRVQAHTGPLFTTDAVGLFDIYLGGIHSARRAVYACRACRSFIDRHGGLVSLTAEGVTVPVLWNPQGIPELFRLAVHDLERIVCRAKVTGVFLSKDPVLGLPFNIHYTTKVRFDHLHGTNPRVFRHPLLSAEQMMAQRKEEFGMLCRGLAEYPIDAVREAVRVLSADNALARSEAVHGVAEWLLALHERVKLLRGEQRKNVIWLAVAAAPPGWCHVKTTMIHTLLDDILAGHNYETVQRRWVEKMHPLKYQRPQAAPSAGTIAQAEKTVAALGTAGALNRRFACLSEVVALWRPRAESAVPATPPPGGVFSHLGAAGRGSSIRHLELPTRTMTWEKFRTAVLPSAARIELKVPYHETFYGLVTATDPVAPPIVQWDGKPRNPVTWYIYHGGSDAHNWNLQHGMWCEVTALFLRPHAWHPGPRFDHIGDALYIALHGARDVKYQKGGGFFPSQLRSEYHAVRSVMEAYAKEAVIAGRDEGDANGVLLQKDCDWDAVLRVTDRTGGQTEYRLDRWE